MMMLTTTTSGLFTALLRAAAQARRLAPSGLHWVRIALVAFAIQWSAFGCPSIRTRLSDQTAALALIISLVLLLVFAWANRRQPGFWILILGTCLNLLVIAANGGFMPVSPETVHAFAHQALQTHLVIGERVGYSKDILLPASETTFWFLSDRFLFPAWIPYQVAFSLGDVFIVCGAFWALWSAAGE